MKKNQIVLLGILVALLIACVSQAGFGLSHRPMSSDGVVNASGLVTIQYHQDEDKTTSIFNDLSEAEK